MTQNLIETVAWAVCPYNSDNWDPARPEEYPLPECKRCKRSERGIPGCLYFSQLQAKAAILTTLEAIRDDAPNHDAYAWIDALRAEIESA